MSADLTGFDASTVPEQQEFTALPEGQYVMIATSSEWKPTKSGTGKYLQFVYEVLDGPFKGRKIWARLNLQNQNQTAVDIAQRELAALCRAVGVIKPTNSAELHNRPFLASVGIEVDDRKRESNSVKKYEAVGTAGSMAAAPAPVAQAAAPAWGSPAPAPAPAPAAAASATPPWKR